MTVKELKSLLEKAPDDMQVLIPMNAGEGFDGYFFSPCVEESGEAGLGTEDIDEEEIKEMELLNKPLPQEKSFVLVPCGFYEEKHGVEPELN